MVGDSTVFNCCCLSLLYFAVALCSQVDYQHNHVFFADGDVLGKCSRAWVSTELCSISLFLGSFIVCQFMNN